MFARPSILVILGLMALAGCSSRQDVAKSIAVSGGLSETVVSTAAFDLFAYTRLTPGHPTLTVYLEGDGYAWISPTRISDDPTPRDPVALRMAVRDPSPSVAYLARPCQYVVGANRHGCSPVYWANGRFAPEVIAAEAAAIRTLMARAGATNVRLIGYSGGGAVALLLPRYGIMPERIITVSGVIATAAWVRLHDLSPLVGSLDPVDRPEAVATLPQVHFVGANDAVVPRAVADAYVGRIGARAAAGVIEVPGFTHECCWSEQWPSLLRQAEQVLERP